MFWSIQSKKFNTLFYVRIIRLLNMVGLVYETNFLEFLNQLPHSFIIGHLGLHNVIIFNTTIWLNMGLLDKDE